METKNKCRFSVIVGMYNHLKYLPKLIESLENQTFKDMEVIFCDDGSNDGTQEYFKSNPRLRFSYKYKRLWLKRGMRLSKSLNNGLRVAEGEFCLYLMADSFPELDYLEILDKKVDMNSVVCGIRIQVDNGQGVDLDWRLTKNMIPQHEVIVMREPYNALTGNGLTVPRKALIDLGMWDEKIEGYGGDDNLLVANFYFRGFLCRSVPSLKLYHNWHKASTDGGNYKYIRKVLTNLMLKK